MTCFDGSRPWVELGDWPNDDEGEKQARLSAAEHSKQMRQLKAVASNGAQPNGASAADIAAMTTWLKTWLKAREVRGLTSVRGDRGGVSYRVWVPDGKKKLVSRNPYGHPASGAIGEKSATPAGATFVS